MLIPDILVGESVAYVQGFDLKVTEVIFHYMILLLPAAHFRVVFSFNKFWRKDMRKVIYIFCIFTAFNTYADTLCDNSDICTFDCAATSNDSCTATLDKNTNTLTIKGYGDMKNYSHSCDPWCHNTADWGAYSSQIYKVVIENESSDKIFKSIGSSAFEYLFDLREAVLPEGLQKISGGAFNDTQSLEKINLPNSLTFIGGANFNRTKVEDIVLPKDVILEDEDWTLGGTELKSLTISGSTMITKKMLTNSINKALSESLAIYCEDTNASCQALLDDEEIGDKIKFYQKYSTGYYYNGRFYSSPNDIYNQHYAPKRIYTIDEANQVAGKTNTFSIRYR